MQDAVQETIIAVAKQKVAEALKVTVTRVCLARHRVGALLKRNSKSWSRKFLEVRAGNKFD